MHKLPVVLVDDDTDDIYFIQEAAKCVHLDRPLLSFKSGNDFITYLRTSPEPPYLIICDMNMPDDCGFNLRQRIQDDPTLHYKMVPFIFWSDAASPTQIKQAYDLPSHGFFFKPHKFAELCSTLDIILKYWEHSKHPKQVA